MGARDIELPEGTPERELLSLIGMFALINGALVQVIMASRMIYGLARLGKLPALLGTVHPGRRTPLVATAISCAIPLVLALLFPLEGLAEAASAVTLVTFALVNLSLCVLKQREAAPAGALSVPLAVPVVGFVLSLGFVLYRAADLL